MHFRSTLCCTTLLLILFLLFPPLSVRAESQREFHALSEKARLSGASPEDHITGRSLSALLDYPLSDENEALTLYELCDLMRDYLVSKDLTLPSCFPLSSEATAENSYNAAVSFLLEGEVLGTPPTDRELSQPVTLARACLILSRLLARACPMDLGQPVSSVEKKEEAGAEVLQGALMLGHSNAIGLGLMTQSPMAYAAQNGISAVNFLSADDLYYSKGSGGSAADILRSGQYAAVYIMLGTNDLTSGVSMEEYRSHLGNIIELAAYYQPQAKLCLIGISPLGFSPETVSPENSPANILAYNRIQKSLSRDHGIAYLDIFTPLASHTGYNRADLARRDGIHYQESGYELILSILCSHPLY